MTVERMRGEIIARFARLLRRGVTLVLPYTGPRGARAAAAGIPETLGAVANPVAPTEPRTRRISGRRKRIARPQSAYLWPPAEGHTDEPAHLGDAGQRISSLSQPLHSLGAVFNNAFRKSRNLRNLLQGADGPPNLMISPKVSLLTSLPQSSTRTHGPGHRHQTDTGKSINIQCSIC